MFSLSTWDEPALINAQVIPLHHQLNALIMMPS